VPATLIVDTTTVGETAGLGDTAPEGEFELPHADKIRAVNEASQIADLRFNPRRLNANTS